MFSCLLCASASKTGPLRNLSFKIITAHSDKGYEVTREVCMRVLLLSLLLVCSCGPDDSNESQSQVNHTCYKPQEADSPIERLVEVMDPASDEQFCKPLRRD